jgi:single-strand selective monofunctional uracil DNA glycosylase
VATAALQQAVSAARQLGRATGRLAFARPITHVYNPLVYAWEPHRRYLELYGEGPKRVLFLGMNPGPFGMVQTGVPFGEISAVRDWLGIHGKVGSPAEPHPQRPVLGFECPRGEVSGQRLWGLFRARFGQPQAFFAEHFVVNYCPLAFVEESGRNFTPDKLPAREKAELFAVCDEHLRQVVAAWQPEWVIGVGDFARKRAEEALAGRPPKIGRILHPSPASPAANRGWAEAATRQMMELGLWR